MTTRPSTAAPILAVLAIGLVTLAAYVGGYFWLGKTFQVNDSYYGAIHGRRYPTRWLVTAFTPAAKLEGWVLGIEVDITSGGTPIGISTLRH